MKIIIDSREQKPLSFPRDKMVSQVVRLKLDVGDYGFQFREGYRCKVFFERKSIPDLFSTLTSGYERFRREIMRAKNSEVELIVAIEGTISEVLKGHKHSKVKGLTILKTLSMLRAKYKISHQFYCSRKMMAKGILEQFTAFGRLYEQETRVKKQGSENTVL